MTLTTTANKPLVVMALSGGLLLPLAARTERIATADSAGASRAAVVAAIESAQPGATVALLAGVFNLSEVRLPTGVTVEGAGEGDTVIDAGGRATGFIIAEAEGIRIRNLRIRNASMAALQVVNAKDITLSGVMLSDSLTGLNASGVAGLRVENSLFINNRTGLSVNRTEQAAIVNNLLLGNASLGMAIVDVSGSAVFNNIIGNGAMGIYIGGDRQSLSVDHNAYYVNFIGSIAGENFKGSKIEAWRNTTGGLDRHSIFTQLETDEEPATFGRILTPKTWAPGESVVAGLGVPSLGGLAAPERDIQGQVWHRGVDLGPYRGALSEPARPPSGQFEVQSNQGVKSAAIYDSQGRQVVQLFQNLPLPAGTYAYWAPPRNQYGQPIPAGEYRFKLIESDLYSEHLGMLAKNARDMREKAQFGFSDAFGLFDAETRPYLVKGWSEAHSPIRAYDQDLTTLRWYVSGSDTPVGAAIHGDSIFWMIMHPAKAGTDAPVAELRRISLDDGSVQELADGDVQRVYPDLLAGPQSVQRGLAASREMLFISDPIKGRLYYTPIANPTFATYREFASPWSVTYDDRNDLIWLIDGGSAVRDGGNYRLHPLDASAWKPRLVAVSAADASVVATFAGTPFPLSVSARNGRLAVATAEGTVAIYNCADPRQLRLERTLGRGDGPYGPIVHDRFFWQTDEVTAMHVRPCSVALDAAGRLLVVDGVRTMFFDAQGQVISWEYGQWGQHSLPARFAGLDDLLIFGLRGNEAIRVDSRRREWTPHIHWELPAFNFPSRSPLGFFTSEGRNFAVMTIRLAEAFQRKGIPGPAHAVGILEYKPDGSVDTLVVYRNQRGGGVLKYTGRQVGETLTEDHLVEDDKGGLLLREDGSAGPSFGWGRYGLEVRANGDLIALGNHQGGRAMGQLIRFRGFDDDGVPAHDFAHLTHLPATVNGGPANVPSPYDWTTPELLVHRIVQSAPASDGGLAGAATIKTGGGMGLHNGAGSDIVGFGPDGELRWIHFFSHLPGMAGVQSLPSLGLAFSMFGNECSYSVMDDRTGLGLGALGMTPDSAWRGMWSDHAQQQDVWIGNDGQPYYFVSDYTLNAHHWFAIRGIETIRRHEQPLIVDDAQAEQLAALPASAPGLLAAPPPPTLSIARLNQPLPIDGNPQKWRDANVPVTAIITPETARGDITGPADCSAIIRFAYEGDNLYMQALVFDDIVTFHQPVGKMYQQDGIELSINSFMSGLKFNLGLIDGVPTVKRDKFVVQAATMVFDEDTVPRSIIVYDNARDFPERKLIEDIYGEDISGSRVIAYEMKLPLNDQGAYAGTIGTTVKVENVAPGESFFLGIFVNDNDVPGADIQYTLAFPATYGTFEPMERSARAVFE